MIAYINYFKLRIVSFIQYKTAAIAGITTQFFWGLMMIFIYYAFYVNGKGASEISLSAIITYTWLHQAFYAFASIRLNDNEISDSISSGGVAYEIIRPYNLYFWWYIKTIAKRLVSCSLRFVPVIVFAFILPQPYGLSLPSSIPNFLLFLLSMMLGLLLVSAINMIVYSIGFSTYNESGISMMLYTVMEFLSGGLVPVPLLPMFIQKSTYYLPFRLISDLSFRLYSNNIGISEGLLGIGLQIIWIVILIFIGNLIIKKSLRKVFVQGG